MGTSAQMCHNVTVVVEEELNDITNRNIMSHREMHNDKAREVNIFYEPAFSLTSIISAHPKLQTLVIVGQPEVTSVEAISGLKRLKELWIVECCLTINKQDLSVDQDAMALKKCLRLEKLYLYTNNIREVPDLSRCEKLKVLSLARNRIRDIQKLDGISHLEDLNIADNDIESIPNIFSSSSELVHINLSKNPLNQQQDIERLCDLTRLRGIEFADPVYGECPLVTLYNYRPYLVRRLPSLQEIDYFPISPEERENTLKNELSFYYQTWPKNLSNEYLLDGAGISRMFSPVEFARLTHLTVSKCSISEVNLANISLPSLESLDLSYNKISSLRGLKSFRKLHTLCLSHNQLGDRGTFENTSSSESDVFDISKLSVLYADHNGLRSVADLGFPRILSLQYLFLQHNKISDLNGIEEYPNLISVVLDHNKIDYIAEDRFRRNSDIRTLLLENNKLTSLRFAKHLPKIEKLFVAKNKINNKLEIGYLGALSNLRELTILGNPLSDCCILYTDLRETIGSIKKIDGHSASTDNSSIFEEVK